LVLGALLIATSAVLEPPHRTDERFMFPIPPGTAEKVAAGQNIEDILPPRITTTVGVELVVQNEDSANHIFGPFLLTPGQAWHQRFAMAGDYPMVCSLYPTDFVVAVLPPEGEGAASTAHRSWLVVWAIVCAVAAGTTGYYAAAVGTRTVNSDSEPPPANGQGIPPWVGYSCVIVPGATISLIALHALALSRLSPWQASLTSRALPFWMAATVVSVFVAALPWLGGQFVDAWQASAAATGLMAVVVAVGAWPTMGLDAIGAALVTAGAGLLGAALADFFGRPERGPRVTRESVAPMALTGFVLVLAGLPWPGLGPTVDWARVGMYAALSIALAVGAVRVRRRGAIGLAAVIFIGAVTLATEAIARLVAVVMV
jgi:hypothetical protein